MIDRRMQEVDDQVIQAIESRPSLGYVALVAICFALILAGFIAFLFQYAIGMGVTGLSVPVGWAVYISNYVFWIAVAMSGTFISAMLFLFRTDWRSTINRIAETMTVVGVMIAGLFPIVHLGRVWVFWWVMPYPNWRHLWPNFKSPLVWDALVIGTYLTVSAILLYLGLIPDLATVRDKTQQGWRKRLYTFLALGWTGEYEKWRHYARGYLAVAAVSMPLAMAVHSITSWDFSMGLLPGWHSTFYAPYFISGAILSGLATIITLLVPLRKVLKLENIFRPYHFRQMALLMVLMASILGYSYAVEAFMDWYSGDIFNQQFSAYRAYGTWYYSTLYWFVIAVDVLLPMTFLFRKLRSSIPYLLISSIFINIGMWIERYIIVVVSLSHGYLPSSWGIYAPHAPEMAITGLAIGMLVSFVLIFVKLFPPVALADVKKDMVSEQSSG